MPCKARWASRGKIGLENHVARSDTTRENGGGLEATLNANNV